ncbi:class I SAM-dependent methyltransferase [Myxococcota bacterium]|nr:class I SAM-dependent methyltransferase [Myxococcota bacterium]
MDPVTGERLDDASALYRADLARHRAAYHFARTVFGGDRTGAGFVLDLGCGTGYGTRELADCGLSMLGLDRVVPAERARGGGAHFVVGDLLRLPFADGILERAVCFQVIEHFDEAVGVLSELARVMRPDGLALLSTPNRLQSDGENPFHPREYSAEELARVLSVHFEEVELRGVHAVGAAARYHADRLRQIRRVVRLDPLRLRRRIPRRLIEWSFARLSLVVRRLIRRSGALAPVSEADYPVGDASADCLDVLAICRRPRSSRGGAFGGVEPRR